MLKAPFFSSEMVVADMAVAEIMLDSIISNTVRIVIFFYHGCHQVYSLYI